MFYLYFLNILRVYFTTNLDLIGEKLKENTKQQRKCLSIILLQGDVRYCLFIIIKYEFRLFLLYLFINIFIIDNTLHLAIIIVSIERHVILYFTHIILFNIRFAHEFSIHLCNYYLNWWFYQQTLLSLSEAGLIRIIM